MIVSSIQIRKAFGAYLWFRLDLSHFRSVMSPDWTTPSRAHVVNTEPLPDMHRQDGEDGSILECLCPETTAKFVAVLLRATRRT